MSNRLTDPQRVFLLYIFFLFKHFRRLRRHRPRRCNAHFARWRQVTHWVWVLFLSALFHVSTLSPLCQLRSPSLNEYLQNIFRTHLTTWLIKCRTEAERTREKKMCFVVFVASLGVSSLGLTINCLVSISYRVDRTRVTSLEIHLHFSVSTLSPPWDDKSQGLRKSMITVTGRDASVYRTCKMSVDFGMHFRMNPVCRWYPRCRRCDDGESQERFQVCVPHPSWILTVNQERQRHL